MHKYIQYCKSLGIYFRFFQSFSLQHYIIVSTRHYKMVHNMDINNFGRWKIVVFYCVLRLVDRVPSLAANAALSIIGRHAGQYHASPFEGNRDNRIQSK